MRTCLCTSRGIHLKDVIVGSRWPDCSRTVRRLVPCACFSIAGIADNPRHKTAFSVQSASVILKMRASAFGVYKRTRAASAPFLPGTCNVVFIHRETCFHKGARKQRGTGRKRGVVGRQLETGSVQGKGRGAEEGSQFHITYTHTHTRRPIPLHCLDRLVPRRAGG